MTRTPAVERVSLFDSTAKLDLGRQKKFEAALTKAADAVRRSFSDAEARQSAAAPKKK